MLFCISGQSFCAKHDKVSKHYKNQLNKVEDLFFCQGVVGGCQAVAMQLLGCSGKVVIYMTFEVWWKRRKTANPYLARCIFCTRVFTKFWPKLYGPQNILLYEYLSKQYVKRKNKASALKRNAFMHSILSTWMWISLIKIATFWVFAMEHASKHN